MTEPTMVECKNGHIYTLDVWWKAGDVCPTCGTEWVKGKPPAVTCEKGHTYVPAEWAGGVCPECSKDWALLFDGELDAISDVQRLRLEPGDTVVVLCDHPLPHKEQERLSEQFGARFPDNQILVLTGGLRLAVVGPDK